MGIVQHGTVSSFHSYLTPFKYKHTGKQELYHPQLAFFICFCYNGKVGKWGIVERVAQSLDKMNSSTDNLVMLYAGGLHYNRWKVLSKIANALKCINESNPIKCQLKIYSSQNINYKNLFHNLKNMVR